MPFQFNNGQMEVINAAIDFYRNGSEQVFQFTGPPGTGKSVVLSEILRRLSLPVDSVAPMAYTGAAAIVMRLKGLPTARTIHSWLYEPIEVPMLDDRGRPIIDTYLNRPVMTLTFRPRDLRGIKLIIFDEGWTVPRSMLNDILKIGAKIIVAGDPDQLPPVADEPAFFTSGKIYHLTEIMRQASDSPIIFLANRAIKDLPIHTGLYGNVLVICQDELTDDMIRASPVVLCAKNTTRDAYNERIRKEILGFDGPLPQYGEKLLCRHNNWQIDHDGISLTNGLSGIVINAPDVSKFDGKNFCIDFVPDIDPRIRFNQLSCDYKYLNANKTSRESIRMYHNFSGNLFEYGYTQTVHLAQGSQWTHGIYLEEYMNPDLNRNLNYTALTRFSTMCIYVKERRRFQVFYGNYPT